VTSTAGYAAVRGPTGSTPAHVVVQGLAVAEWATVTVETTMLGWANGSATMTANGAPGAARVPLLGAMTRNVSQGGALTVSINNWSSIYDWSVSVGGGGSATLSVIGGTFSGDIVVTGLPSNIPSPDSAAMTVTASRLGYDTGLFTANTALVPVIGSIVSDMNSFQGVLENYDSNWEWAATTTNGAAALVPVGPGQWAKVEGLQRNDWATLTITTSRDGHLDGKTSVLGYTLPLEPTITKIEDFIVDDKAETNVGSGWLNVGYQGSEAAAAAAVAAVLKNSVANDQSNLSLQSPAFLLRQESAYGWGSYRTYDRFDMGAPRQNWVNGWTGSTYIVDWV